MQSIRPASKTAATPSAIQIEAPKQGLWKVPAVGLLALILGMLFAANALRALPVANEGYHELSRASALSGEARDQALKRSIALLTQAQRLQPDDVTITRHLAEAYLQSGQAMTATALLENAYRLAPSSLMLESELLIAYERAGSTDKVEALLKLRGPVANQLRDQGLRAAQQGNYSAAVSWYEQAATAGIDTLSSQAYLRYLILKDQGGVAQANPQLAAAIDADHGWAAPLDRFIAWYRWGEYQLAARQPAQALAALNEAEQTYVSANLNSPTYASLLRARGLAYDMQGRWQLGLQQYQLSAEQNPRFAWAWMSYGVSLYVHTSDRRAEALAAIDKALALEPQNPDLWKALLRMLATHSDGPLLKAYCLRAPAALVPSITACAGS